MNVREPCQTATESASFSNPPTLPNASLQLSPRKHWSYPSDNSYQPIQEPAFPSRHLTAPQHLLAWPSSPVILTERDRRYPLELEIRNARHVTADSLVNIREWLSKLSMNQLRVISAPYFAYIHPQYIILDEDSFNGLKLQCALQNSFHDSMETCLALLVLALGVTISPYVVNQEEWATNGITLNIPDCEYRLLSLAVEIFLKVHETDWPSIQCLLLMG